MTGADYARALRLIAWLETQAGELARFARAAVTGIKPFVAAEFVTFTVSDLETGQRWGVGPQGEQPGRRASVYHEGHAATVTLFMDGRTRVSIVLERRGSNFTGRDCECMEILRPHLAFLYRHACHRVATASATRLSARLAPAQPGPAVADLTLREREVMHWLSCGKTNFEIAVLLSISPRTVHKHLEHIYMKLGVETRTAAVMRALAR